MTTISMDRQYMVLINTFDVDPGDADALIAVLTTAIEDVMVRRPGFISSNLHRSEDGTKLVNYVQWATKADYLAMVADPEAQAHFRKSGALAKAVRPVICDLVYSLDMS